MIIMLSPKKAGSPVSPVSKPPQQAPGASKKIITLKPKTDVGKVEAGKTEKAEGNE
jgi:hypothetical protein